MSTNSKHDRHVPKILMITIIGTVHKLLVVFLFFCSLDHV